MAWKTLKLEESGAVCTLTLNRPEAGNRINVLMVRELEEACYLLEDESPASLVVLRGQPGCFTQGIDLSEFSLHRVPDVHGFHRWEKALEALERLKKVTVAMIEGPCRGGGVQLALACDLRLATSEATLQLDEVKMGFLPGMACYRLPRFVGLGRARDLLFSGRPLEAGEALALGLVDRLCPPEQAGASLSRLLAELLPVNGTTVGLARRLLNEAYPLPYEDFLGGFLAAQARAITSDPFLRTYQQALTRPAPEEPGRPSA